MADKTEARGDNDTLHEQVEHLRADLAAIAKTLHEVGGERAGAAYARVREMAEHHGGRIGRGARSVTHEIEERPLIAVLGAFVLGVLLGALVGRR